METSFAFAERKGGAEERASPNISLYRAKKESMHTDISGFEPLVGPKLLYATGLSFQEGDRTVSVVR
tara:strand:+ start:261 stop:461 length:201 start_codon:yes stop_codon:yes gene_type:complete